MPPVGKGQTRAEQREGVLMDIIQCDHRVIEANTAAMSRLVATLDGMQQTLSLLVGQVTTSISQRNDGVPLRVFLVVTVGLIVVLFTVIGLDAANIYHIGGTP